MVHVISVSRKGTKSTVNEDAFLSIPAKGIYVVADGVGGGPAGDFASRTVVQEIEGLCKESVSPEDDLLSAIQAANHKIFEAAQSPRLNGMATTVAAAVISQGSVFVCHVGDSRVYNWANGKLVRLTRDHIRLIEKSDDSRKWVVSNALGVRRSVKVEFQRFEYQAGSSLLLMTDGVSDLLDDGAMETTLGQSESSMSDKLNKLIELSESLGGQDDKTIVCVF